MNKNNKAKLRKLGPPPTLLSLSPKGTIEALPFSKNSNSPVIMRRGSLILASHMVEDGWMSLSKAYAMDSRPQVAKHGLKTYKDWLHARRMKRAETIRDHKHADGSFREKFAPYPRHLLPEEAVMRLEGRGSNAIESFVPGIPGIIDNDPHEEALAMEPGPRSHGGTVTTVVETAVEAPAVDEAPAPKKQSRRRAQASSDAPESSKEA